MTTTAVATRCRFQACDHQKSPASGSRGWCAGHLAQYYFRGRDTELMSPLREGKRLRPDEIAGDVEELEMLLRSGASIESAVQRVGLSASALVVRFQRCGRPVPPGLWGLTKRRERVQ